MFTNKIKLILNTLKYLKIIQVNYRIYYFFRNKIFTKEASIKQTHITKAIKWKNILYSNSTYSPNFNTFTYLNISHSFFDQINWNFSEFGKLWTYNLNYFDFLNQKKLSGETGIKLILDYLNDENLLIDGKESYPISLRGINWIKFLANNSIKLNEIDHILLNHYYTLLKNLEYHLLGNHLLENAFSLLFGAYYFQDEKLYFKSRDLLVSELNEQVLKDGAHFELSPMYHQIILSRLLDCVQLIKLNKFWKKDDLLSFLEAKAGLMNSWLKNITYKNGNIPMVNDSTFNIAPNSKKIFNYVKHLGLNSKDIPLSDSGYRKINSNNYELLIDVGNVGPDYQPGHAHSDTFNFEFIKQGKPIIVDVGTSTYEKNAIRQSERATHSHNTVKIGSKDQTQVWGGFRVAKRAKITHLIEKSNLIEASHDGYMSDGYKHTRSFIWGEKYLILKDKINRSTINNAKAYFHLHFSVSKPLVDGNNVILESSGVSIEFERASSICIEEYQLSIGFNKTNLAYKIVVLFDQTLKTKISL